MTNLSKNKKPTSNLIANQRGIALVLTVLVLSNLLMIAFIVADVILRIGKTSRAIGESEAAYYAAESAIEKAVYKIEKEQDATEIGTEATPAGGIMSDARATWARYLKPVNTVSGVICIDNNNVTTVYSDPAEGVDENCIYTETPDTVITKNSPLKVRLQPGKSFDIDFSILVPSGLIFYPPSIDIDWPANTAGRIVIHTISSQAVIDTSINPHHTTISLGTQNPRTRILNEDSAPVIYTVSPGSSTAGIFMPIGMEVTAQGYYSSLKERIIVVNRKNWKIY